MLGKFDESVTILWTECEEDVNKRKWGGSGPKIGWAGEEGFLPIPPALEVWDEW